MHKIIKIAANGFKISSRVVFGRIFGICFGSSRETLGSSKKHKTKSQCRNDKSGHKSKDIFCSD